MTLRLVYTIASDRGLVRDNNEDSAYAGPNLLIIADGMGGHAAGEVASQLMVNHMARLDSKIREFPAEFAEADKLALLGAYAEDANVEIAETVQRRPETDGMGTTLTGMLFDGRELALIHAGDSRGYRLRNGVLEQLTIDDTFVQSLVNEGKLDPEDVSSHPRKSLILKAYTGQPVEPTLRVLDARPGDRLLLCSDGLSDPVTASTITDALRTGTPATAATRLVELALRSGGPDNVTVIVADVLEDEHLDEKSRAALPSTPMLGGALAGEHPEHSHPDTAAGRAAAWSRRPQVIPPTPGAEPAPPAAAPAPAAAAAPADDPDEEGPRSGSGRGRGRWLGLTLVLVLLVALGGGAWWVSNAIDSNYYLAVNEDEDFVIHQGVDYSVFGRELNDPLQTACINRDGGLRFVDVNPDDGRASASCAIFGLEDLPDSVRASVAGLEGGSYDEVTQQMRRLADQALPVCLTRESETPETESPETMTDEPASGDLNQPGVNCREVA